MQKFTATIQKIDINPYVPIPCDILSQILKDAGKEKGPIPVRGTLQGKPFIQTLVKFCKLWRLYINTPMCAASHTKVGDTVTIEICFDPSPRMIPTPKLFTEALAKNKIAKEAFEKLPPYRQKEINRYLANLKSEEKLKYNIERTIQFLLGEKIKGVLYY